MSSLSHLTPEQTTSQIMTISPVKFYCSLSSFFIRDNGCNKPAQAPTIITQDNTNLIDQISTLQNQLNNVKPTNTITYTSPSSNQHIVYIQGPKGDKGDKGDTTVIPSSNTTNWSSVWVPTNQYQYVPVSSGGGSQGPAGPAGPAGSSISQITQDASSTTYYLL